MNIGKIEEESGISRANIRYYEQEGLLCPARAENGYRDYSTADLAALQKIKLLRQLGIPVETIRRLQTGEEQLGDILAARAEALSYGAEAARTAQTVCARMQQSVPDYNALRPEEWWPLLEAPPTPQPTLQAAPTAGSGTVQQFSQPQPAYPAAPEGWEQAHPHVWLRRFARSADMALCLLPIWFVLFYLLRVPLPASQLGQGLFLLWPLVAMLFAEPLLLTCFGTTPGKWLAGMRIQKENGSRLSYTEGFLRTWGVFWYGLGLNIPLWGVWRQFRAYADASTGQRSPWQEYDEQYIIARRAVSTAALRVVGLLAAEALCSLLAIWCALWTPLPIQHGNITVADFAANYNQNAPAAAGVVSVGDAAAPYYYLNADGGWDAPEYLPPSAIIQWEDGTPLEQRTDIYFTPLEYRTAPDGAMTYLRYTFVPDPEAGLYVDRNLLGKVLENLYWAYVWAQPEAGPLAYLTSPYHEPMYWSLFEGGTEFTCNGIHVLLAVEDDQSFPAWWNSVTGPQAEYAPPVEAAHTLHSVVLTMERVR